MPGRRTTIKKEKHRGYTVTNYAGHKFHVMTKERANEIASASRRVAKKHKKR